MTAFSVLAAQVYDRSGSLVAGQVVASDGQFLRRGWPDCLAKLVNAVGKRWSVGWQYAPGFGRCGAIELVSKHMNPFFGADAETRKRIAAGVTRRGRRVTAGAKRCGIRRKTAGEKRTTATGSHR